MLLENLFGSRVRARVVGWLFSHPDERFFVRQLTSIIGEDSTNVSRELSRLEQLGLVVASMEGRQKYYQADQTAPIFEELKGIALKTVGAADVIREALSPFGDSISLSFIYGSLAAGDAGPGSDVDLLVVGTVDEVELHARISRAEELLRRTVSCTLLGPDEFRQRKQQQGEFLDRVLHGRLIPVVGDVDRV